MKCKHLLFFLIITSCAALSSPAVVASTTWEPAGLNGGDQFDIKISPDDPNTIYSVAYFGLHRSTDAGANWKPIHTRPMSAGGFLTLAFDPQQVGGLFVANYRSGVWHSTNQGDTWQQCNSGLPFPSNSGLLTFPVVSLTITSERVLFAGFGEDSVTGEAPPAWIYRSTDGGANWMPSDIGIVSPPGELSQKRYVLLNKDETGRPWAMVYGSGVYAYENGEWTSRNGDLPAAALRCTFLEHDMTDKDHILLGTESSWIYETKNGGTTWSVLPFPEALQGMDPLPLVYTLRTDPNNSRLIYVSTRDATGSNEQPLFAPRPDQLSGAGDYISVDGGTSWFLIGKDTFRVTIDPRETMEDAIPGLGLVRRSRIWYRTSGSYASIQKSEDGSRTFNIITSGVHNAMINSLGQHASPSGQVTLAAVEGAIYSKSANASKWEIQRSSSNSIYTWSFANDASDPTYIFYGMGNPAWSYQTERGIYRLSLDCLGYDCPLAEQVLSDVGVWKVVTTPAAPDIIYAGCQEKGIMVSLDRGKTWQPLNGGLTLPKSVTDIQLDDNGVLLYASTRTSDGHFTVDGAQGWWPSTDEEGRVYKFDAQSGNWLEMQGITSAVLDLELAPQAAQELYAATVTGVYKTSDGGATWTVLLPDVLANDLLIDPNRPNYLYAATSTCGVMRSTDAGNTWRQISDGLTTNAVFSLAMDAETGVIYAATGGNSVFQMIPDPDPQPEILVSSTLLDFGTIPLGASQYSYVRVGNDGESDLVISEITSTDPAFSICEVTFPITLSPQAVQTIKVKFAPLRLGITESLLAIVSNDPGNPDFSIPVKGEAREPVAPTLTILANDLSNEVSVRYGTRVEIALSISAGEVAGQSAEWWLGATAGTRSVWFAQGKGWMPSETPLLARTGPVINTATPVSILSGTLPKGTYQFRFSLDPYINGNMDGTWSKTLTLTVN